MVCHLTQSTCSDRFFTWNVGSNSHTGFGWENFQCDRLEDRMGLWTKSSVEKFAFGTSVLRLRLQYSNTGSSFQKSGVNKTVSFITLFVSYQ